MGRRRGINGIGGGLRKKKLPPDLKLDDDDIFESLHRYNGGGGGGVGNGGSWSSSDEVGRDSSVSTMTDTGEDKDAKSAPLVTVEIKPSRRNPRVAVPPPPSSPLQQQQPNVPDLFESFRYTGGASLTSLMKLRSCGGASSGSAAAAAAATKTDPSVAAEPHAAPSRKLPPPLPRKTSACIREHRNRKTCALGMDRHQEERSAPAPPQSSKSSGCLLHAPVDGQDRDAEYDCCKVAKEKRWKLLKKIEELEQKMKAIAKPAAEFEMGMKNRKVEEEENGDKAAGKKKRKIKEEDGDKAAEKRREKKKIEENEVVKAAEKKKMMKSKFEEEDGDKSAKKERRKKRKIKGEGGEKVAMNKGRNKEEDRVTDQKKEKSSSTKKTLPDLKSDHFESHCCIGGGGVGGEPSSSDASTSKPKSEPEQAVDDGSDFSAASLDNFIKPRRNPIIPPVPSPVPLQSNVDLFESFRYTGASPSTKIQSCGAMSRAAAAAATKAVSIADAATIPKAHNVTETRAALLPLPRTLPRPLPRKISACIREHRNLSNNISQTDHHAAAIAKVTKAAESKRRKKRKVEEEDGAKTADNKRRKKKKVEEEEDGAKTADKKRRKKRKIEGGNGAKAVENKRTEGGMKDQKTEKSSGTKTRSNRRRSFLRKKERTLEAYKRLDSSDTQWIPPASEFHLLQEEHYEDPWKVLVICMLLNVTTGHQVEGILQQVLERLQNARAALAIPDEELKQMIKSLGLYNLRTKRIKDLSRAYLESDWKYVCELPGVGKYGADAYAIFCKGRPNDVIPDDHRLVPYWEFVCEQLRREQQVQ